VRTCARRAARGVCIGIRDASRAIRGREIKEVLHLVRASVGPGATITMSIGSDNALEDGALEVDIFAFGEFDEAELGIAADAGGSPEAAWQGEDASGDPLYAAARSLVLRSRRASISLVQRHLRIGYGRASRLLDAMEGDVLSVRGEDGMRLVLGLN
jgi:DNA segregation ATPase FtsK/SpoIIIE-like protein